MISEFQIELEVEVTVTGDERYEDEDFREVVENDISDEITDVMESVVQKIQNALGCEVSLDDYDYTDGDNRVLYLSIDEDEPLTLDKLKAVLAKADTNVTSSRREKCDCGRQVSGGYPSYDPPEYETVIIDIDIDADIDIGSIEISSEDEITEDIDYNSCIYTCPVCHNKSVCSVTGDCPDYDDLCVCEECGSEFRARPQSNGTMKFVIDQPE